MKYTFVWGDVQSIVIRLSNTRIRRLREYCKRLIARAEWHRENAARVVKITDNVELGEDDHPFAPFEMFGYYFRLEYKEETREYVLNFAADPMLTPPSPGGSAAHRPARSGRAPHGAARPAKARRPPRATKLGADERSPVHWRMLGTQKIRAWIGAALNANRTLFASIFTSMHEAGLDLTNRVHELADAAAVHACSVAATARRIHGSWGRSHDFDLSALGVARLQPRLMGQNSGLRLLLYSFARDEPAIDCSVGPFGDLPDKGERAAI